MRRSLLALCALIVIGGCSSKPGSPTEPTAAATTTPASPAAGGATIQGAVAGGATAALRPTTTLANVSLTVSVVGTSIGVTVDSTNHFVLVNVPAGDQQLQFSGAGVDARLAVPAVQAAETINLSLVVSGGSAAVVSQSRTGPNAPPIPSPGPNLPPTPPDPPSNPSVEVELEGFMSGLTGACPAIGFKVDTTSVTADANTVFSPSCSVAHDGARVHVHGIRQTDGSLKAARLEITPATPTQPPVELEGLLSGLTGACPSITFTIAATTVSTDGSTTVTPTCAAAANGARAHVKGVRQSDGSVKATSVDIQVAAPPPAGDEVELEGTAANVTGSCPAIRFSVTGKTVVTDSATSFDPSCAAVQTGTKVSVKGTTQTNGDIKASEVKKK